MIEIETGTDVAAIAIADPSTLGELRSSTGRDFERRRDAAIADGHLWRADTGADGAYLIHLFVNEDPPAAVSTFLRDPQVVEVFRIPSGRLLIAGEELVVTPQSIAKYPHMGREVEVPPGAYELTAYRVDEDRDDAIEEKFAATATASQKRAWDRGNSSPMISFVGTLVAIVLAYWILARTASFVFAAIPIAIAIVVWIWQARSRRTSDYVSAERIYRQLERELPSIVVVLRSTEPIRPSSAA